MTGDRLRALAAEATEYRTGPTWFNSDEEGMAALARRQEVLRVSDAYLAALAPELATLLADTIDALEASERLCARSGLCADYDSLLARFRGLGET